MKTTATDKHNRLIRDLLNAMDAVLRSENLEFAKGVAAQAIINIHGECVRNADGYLVVKS